MTAEQPDPPGLRDRIRRFWSRLRVRRFWTRHRTLFWTLHSGWALATGVVVIILARERYGFVPWVVLFLVLTWASTLFFGARTRERAGPSGDGAPGLGEEVTSYLTRTLYQETLFFLLPFYAYSTVLGSANVLFLVLLGGLAILSCLDMVFDRLLRTSVLFGLLFFATVAFAAVNLLLPLLLPVDPGTANGLAGLAAVGSAVPLVARNVPSGWGARARMAVAALALLVLPVAAPALIPPVPLRVDRAGFGGGIDPESLELRRPVEGDAVSASGLDDRLVVLVRVFSPSPVPTGIVLEWRRDGETLRTSREIDIVAHEASFRVWDAWGPGTGTVPPGSYEVELRTEWGAVFGVARIDVLPP